MPIIGLFGRPNVVKLKTRHNIKGLIKALGYEQDSDVRKAAANALGEIGDTRAVEPLIAALKDQWPVAITAIEALGHFGTMAVEPLITILKNYDENGSQRNAAIALGRIGTPAVDPLITILKNDDWSLHKGVIEALKFIGLPAVGPLITVLENQGSYAGFRVVKALKAIGYEPIDPTPQPWYALKLKEQPNTIMTKFPFVDPTTQAWFAVERQLWDVAISLGTAAVGPLIAALQNSLGLKETRPSAAESLGTLGNQLQDVERRAWITDALISALEATRENDQWLWKHYSKALGQIGGTRAIEALVTLLGDSEPGLGVDDSVYPALVKIGTSAVEPLIAALKDENGTRRWYAIRALEDIGDDRAIEPLIELLENKVSNVGWKAAWALYKLGWRPDGDEEKLHYFIKMENWDEVKRLGGLAVGPLIKIAESTSDIDVREGAISTLGHLRDERAIEPLVQALKDPSSGIKCAAARSLSEIGNNGAVVPLIRALEDEDSGVRKEAACALGKIGDRRAVESLLHAMEIAESRVQQFPIPRIFFGSDSEFDEIQNSRRQQRAVLMEIAKALGELRDVRAVQPLARVLRFDDIDQQMISQALISIGEPVVLDLIRTLRDGDSSDRINAARALGLVKDKRAVEPLILALKDEESEVKWRAARALGELEDKRAVESLIHALQDKSSLVRQMSAITLGRIGDRRAVEPLIQALEDEDSDVRKSAKWSLDNI